MGEAWKRWTEVSTENKLELLRSELFLTSGFNNLMFFAVLVVVSIMGAYTIFTIWIPGLFLLISAFSLLERWRDNDVLVERLRGSTLAGVTSGQAKRKGKRGL